MNQDKQVDVHLAAPGGQVPSAASKVSARPEHTPGPWMLASSNSWRRIVTHDGTEVCYPTKQRDGHPDLTFPNGGADGPDARLIASAPELLAALKAIADMPVESDEWDGTEKYGHCRELARAAIAKATGSAT